jgi:DNA-binding NarL/FixJ family response regulator
MTKTSVNRVVVFEDDPYAKDLILKLLSRDWRTRVAGEFDSISQDAFRQFLSKPANKVDTIILDTEVPKNPKLPLDIFKVVQSLPEPPRLIFICTVPTPKYWNDVLLEYDFFGGYLVKQEMLYALGSVVALAAQGYAVTTESVALIQPPVRADHKIAIVDGSQAIQNFTPREKEILRLGIIYNQSQRDMQDELVLSRDWISEVLSSVYEKLQIKEILAGEIPLDTYFTNAVVLSRAQSIIDQHKDKTGGVNLRHAPWIATLAFHLLTIPVVQKVTK